MAHAIIIIIIIVNLPSIIGVVIGIIWGLIEAAAEEVNDCTGESNEDQSSEAFMPGSQEPVFFSGCETSEDLKNRYRVLMKIYHPDMDGGDEKVARMIILEYQMLTGGNTARG